jgi:hypothetical protein
MGGKKKSEIKFNYIKNNNFIINHVDGLHGGLTPRGHLIMNFFCERFPIPNSVTFEINEGNIGKEVDKKSKEGVIREIVSGVVVNLEAAKSINAWLTEKIKEMESLYHE